MIDVRSSPPIKMIQMLRRMVHRECLTWPELECDGDVEHTLTVIGYLKLWFGFSSHMVCTWTSVCRGQVI